MEQRRCDQPASEATRRDRTAACRKVHTHGMGDITVAVPVGRCRATPQRKPRGAMGTEGHAPARTTMVSAVPDKPTVANVRLALGAGTPHGPPTLPLTRVRIRQSGAVTATRSAVGTVAGPDNLLPSGRIVARGILPRARRVGTRPRAAGLDAVARRLRRGRPQIGHPKAAVSLVTQPATLRAPALSASAQRARTRPPI